MSDRATSTLRQKQAEIATQTEAFLRNGGKIRYFGSDAYSTEIHYHGRLTSTAISSPLDKKRKKAKGATQ